MGIDGKTSSFLRPLLVERGKEVLHGENEKSTTFRCTLFAASHQWNVLRWCTAPNLWCDVVTNQFPAQIE